MYLSADRCTPGKAIDLLRALIDSGAVQGGGSAADSRRQVIDVRPALRLLDLASQSSARSSSPGLEVSTSSSKDGGIGGGGLGGPSRSRLRVVSTALMHGTMLGAIARLIRDQAAALTQAQVGCTAADGQLLADCFLSQ